MAEPPNIDGMDTTPPRTFEAAAARAAIPITEATYLHLEQGHPRAAEALAAVEDAYADLYGYHEYQNQAGARPPTTRSWDSTRYLPTTADLHANQMVNQYANLAGRILAFVDTPTGTAIDDIIELVVSKQHDYGHGNILAFGHTGLVVRLSDKLARLKNLMGRDSDPLHESIEDTWQDMVGYCLLGIMLATDTFTLPLEVDL